MQNIMIDMRRICDMNGFSSYLKMILKAINSQNETFYLLVNQNALNFDFANLITDKNKYRLICINSKPFSLFQNIEIPYIIKKYKIEVFHSTNFDIPLLKFSKFKLISTIHDIIPLKYKHLHKRNVFKNIYFELMFRACAYLSESLLTVSNYSKTEIVDYFKISPQKVSVIYNVFEKDNCLKIEHRNKTKNTRLLFVGTNFEHKNILVIIEAVNLLVKSSYTNIFLNIVGSKTKYTTILEKYIINNNLQDNVRILGKVNNTTLHDLYINTDIYVFPSLVEGFGIPLIEAMSYGIPIISSNKTVMPEVIGNAGILIEPTPKNFAEQIKSLIKEPLVTQDLTNKGFKRVDYFTQENFNKNFLRVIQN